MQLGKKFLHITLILALFLSSFPPSIFAYPKTSENIKTKVGEITEEINLKLPSRKLTAITQPDNAIFIHKKEFISDIKTAKFPFDAISASWEENTPQDTKITLYLRFYENGFWSSWKEIKRDPDEGKFKEDKNYGFLLTNQAEKFQYKAVLLSSDGTKTPNLKKINFTYYNSTGGPDPTQIIDPKEILASLLIVDTPNPPVISRAKWGADENLRYMKQEIKEKVEEIPEDTERYDYDGKLTNVIYHDAKGQKYIWPLEYTKTVKRFIIHHTATTSNLDNPAAAIRSIYYYHSVTRGWGDIGYNYLIDQQGRIYEGRAGSEKVVGAHAGYANAESIGIGVLGDYSEEEVPYAVIQSLINLISSKAKKYNIQADKFSMLDGELVANIIGHRDVNDTDCPGRKLYEKLPYLRVLIAYNNAKRETPTKKKDFYFEETSKREIEIFKPEEKKKITIKLKNTGTKTWDSKTYLAALQNDFQEPLIKFKKIEGSDPNKIANLKETSVKPGGIGTFEFSPESNVRSGLINFSLLPIFNGDHRSTEELMLPIYTEKPTLAHALVQSSYPKGKHKINSKIESGWVKLQNTSDIKWRNYGDTKTCLVKVGESECIGFLKQKIVKPGKTGHFTFSYKLTKSGEITEQIVPITQNVGVSKGLIISYTLDVEGKTLKGEFIESSSDNTFKPLEKKSAYIKIKNTGDKIWPHTGKNKLQIVPVKNPDIKIENMTLPEKNIKPGETAEIKFDITAPKREGEYRIYLWIRVGGKSISKYAFYLPIIVTKNSKNINKKTDEPTIRIALSFKGDPIITGDGKFDMYANNNYKGTFYEGQEIELTFKDGKYRVKSGRRAYIYSKPPKFTPKPGTILEIKNWDKKPSWNQEINYNRFRGNLEINNVDGEIVVINELPVEDYLKGLSEEPNDTHHEKIKAITVAARSYAAFYTDPENRKFPGKPYDGSDDPAIFQKYSGYTYELRASNIAKAAEDTKGEVVTYKGELVKTPYFSQDDGRTRSAKEVFGWDAQYLQSVEDPYCEGLEMKGHGVGMSGCGSLGAAKAGKNYKEILKYYYQGVEIRKMW